METLKAEVIKEEEEHFILISNIETEIKIPLTEDNSNIVKSAFNELILMIRENEITIEMYDVGSDLFSQVANEYITQLNREISEVRREMVEFGLIDEVI